MTSIIESLKASAQAFLVAGEESGHALCHRMIRDVVSMNEIFGPGAGDALHRNAASQLAIRATEKLTAHNRKAA